MVCRALILNSILKGEKPVNEETLRVFNKMLVNRHIAIDDDDWQAYLDVDPEKQEITQLCYGVDCRLLTHNMRVYLIPTEKNKWLSYDKQELKRKLHWTKANPVEDEYQLSMLSILILFSMYYPSSSKTIRQRDFVRLEDWTNRIAEVLSSTEGFENEEDAMFIKQLREFYLSKGADFNDPNDKDRARFVDKIRVFLCAQNILEYDKELEPAVSLTSEGEARIEALMENEVLCERLYRLAERGSNA